MPENFENLFNDAKLIQHFENYMEGESIEIKNDKYLEIEIRKFIEEIFDFSESYEVEEYFMNPENPNVIGLLMYIRAFSGNGGESIMEYMNDRVESSIITRKIYKTAVSFKIEELMETRFESECESESESESETEFDMSKIPLIIQACNETEIENEIKEIENEIK